MNKLEFKPCTPFNDSDMDKYTLIKSEKQHPCVMCEATTQYIDYCCEGAFCSKECQAKFYDMVTEQEMLP